MPVVINKLSGKKFDVPDNHFSLNDPNYVVIDDGTHPIKDASEETDLLNDE